MLNSEQLTTIVNKGLLEDKQVQQVSIDLKIAKIQRIVSQGAVLADRTILPTYEEIFPTQHSMRLQDEDPSSFLGWDLKPGYYNVIFEECVDIPSNVGTLVIQRSSVLRNGGTITSSLWDPGFSTKGGNMSSFMTLNEPLFLEKGARIACMYGWYCDQVTDDKLYNGQYQGK